MTPDQRIRDEALVWATRTGDPAFEDWDAFTAWLEADPAHAKAYDEVQFALDDAADALRNPPLAEVEPLAANDNPRGPVLSRRGTWLGAAIAASLVFVASFLLWPGGGGGSLYTTEPGETLTIALADGSTVELAGGSRIAILGDTEREARLEAGQALFTIRHDEANPFVLKAGSQTLVDAGTVFDVRLTGEGLNLAVSEGAVIVNPDALDLLVPAGQQAVLEDGRYRVFDIEAQAVGEWARGRITFREASPAEVAAELTRATGIPFASDGSGEGVRLSGSIALDQVRGDPRVLEAVLGLSMRREGERWIIADD
ncbi:MAG: FecR domain-containing protein [Erythrobacter sp.]|jgi:transmembrane sensor|nr:FecR domain-containing protein [Erythrobacter sp.]